MSRNLQLRPPPGANAETVRVFAELQAQLAVTIEELQRDFERRLSALEGEPAGFEVKRSNFTARAGQVVTVEPPPAGLTVTLPAASATTRRARVVVTAKNANPVRWEATRGLVNGMRQVTSNAPGAAEAICDGEAWHVSLGAATATGSAASTAGAKYLLEEADTGLPNARVADDSTEVDLDYASTGLVSWFLKTASVVFGKLQDLTGLSVLGRAANSSGVMAAITASGARQVLRANDAGTALEWGNPVQVGDDGSVVGDFYSLDFFGSNGLGLSVTDAGNGRAIVSYGWFGLYVYDGATFVNYFQGLRFNDGTGITATVTPSSATGVVRFDWDGTTNLVTGWDGVLAIGNSSGANDVQIDAGQHLNFGAAGPTTSNPQIRSGDSVFRVRAGGVLSLGAVDGAVLFSDGAGLSLAADDGVLQLQTALTTRLNIGQDGAWSLGGTDVGSAGEVLTSQGSGAPPVWASVVVPDGDYGDITVSGTGTTWAIDNNAVTNTKLRDSDALSVIGRASNTSGDPADIVSSADNTILRRASGALGWGQISNAMIPAGTITTDKLETFANQTVLGNGSGGASTPVELGLVQPLFATSNTLSIDTAERLHIVKYADDGVNTALCFRKSRRGHFFFDDFDYVPSSSGGTAIGTGGAGLDLGNWYYQAVNANGTLTVQDGLASHPGIVRLATGSTSGNALRMYRGDIDSTTEPFVGNNIYMFECVVRLNTATSCGFEVGFSNAIGGSPTDAIEFYFDTSVGSTIRCYTEEANTATDTDSGVAPGTGWNVYTWIQESTGTIDFYIDDVLEVSQSTNVPDTEGMNVGVNVLTRTSASRSLDIDYIMYETLNLGARTT